MLVLLVDLLISLCGRTHNETFDTLHRYSIPNMNILTKAGGFPISKTYDSMMNVGEWRYQFSDRARGGTMHEPIVGCAFFGVMHKELRSFDFLQHLYYRLICGVYDWSDSKHLLMRRHITEAKQQAIDHIRKACGFLMDTPLSGGGNTNCGGLAKCFMDPAHRVAICSLILHEEDRNNLSELMGYFNLMFTATQNIALKRRPDISKVKALWTQLMTHIRPAFLDARNRPWVPVIDSVHEHTHGK